MNLGVFAVILAAARFTRSAELDSFNGLFQTSPVLAIAMTIFLSALAGIPPLAGWFAKFSVFTALIEAGTVWGYVLAGVAAINTVIAFGYYGRIASRMWFESPPVGARRVEVPFGLQAALGITVAATILFGVVPQIVTHFSDVNVVDMIAAAQ